ncbi:microtubule-associated futsch-like protein [Rhynchospora pubera]|uniref:Microtubule-associated futsch-like protein n=1 Tax=Rhynchospora pubera TaxID=906938 RepID=A0AAV8DKH8_9POAL|nr:microtubule-associated futsch-like protein [Rhynchospora pubera]
METKSESIAPKGSAVRASKLRYPLRSASKSKEKEKEKEVKDQPVSKRSAKPIADITKSVSALELSGKDKHSAKPPRMLSILAKSVSTPRTTNGPTTTPSSVRSSVPMTETPMSNMSGSTIARRRFSMISSVSYWMAQIKLAEAASKHSVSLGFFKLALEAGCEPLERMGEELKSYIVRHNLSVVFHDSVKDILNVFGITEDPEELKASVNIKSDSPKFNTKSEKSSKTTPVVPASKRNGNLKPRSLNTEVGKKASNAGSKVRISSTKNPVKTAVVKENHKKVTKDEGDGEKEHQTSLENNPSEGSATIVDSTSKLEASYEEEKENMENALVEISAE